MSFIALTAQALAGDRDKCLKADMTDYISEPYDPKSYVKIVQYLLEEMGWLLKYTLKMRPNRQANTTAIETLRRVLIGCFSRCRLEYEAY